MVYCDTSDAILEWGSEEIIIPYLSPWDGRLHRYFPDFYIKVRQADGSLKFVRGSHLFRDPEHCRADTCVDADLEAGWLAGKKHPLTGEPLKVEGLSLPPGSIVSLYAHVAHAVEPRKAGSDRTRWASLFCFRDGEHKGVVEPPPSPGREVPPVWAQRAAQGDVPQVLRSLLEGGGIFGPHWVRYPPRPHT